MKTHDYSLIHVRELTMEEAVSTRGGLTWIGLAISYVLIAALTNPEAHIDSFLKGVSEGYNAVKDSVK